jgi:hypothetical protein
MKTLLAAALALALAAPALGGNADHKGVRISFDSDDPRVEAGDRHAIADARLAVTTRNGAATLLLTGDVVAVQLSDAVMTRIRVEKDASFLERLIVSGVRSALDGSIEYPIAHIRSAGIVDGVLVLTSDEGKRVFENVTIDGENVTRGLSTSDAARFVREFRRAKSGR